MNHSMRSGATPPRQFSSDECVRIRQEHEGGKSVSQLAREASTNNSAVTRAILFAGGQVRCIRATPAQRDEMVRDYIAGATLQEAAAKHGLNLSTCQDALKRAGVRTRPKGQMGPGRPHFNFDDLTGKTFGPLYVVSYRGFYRDKKGKVHLWDCRCKCGLEMVIAGPRLTQNGDTSCGCELANSIKMADEKAAYLAGLFDTEGCFIIKKFKPYGTKYVPSAMLGVTDPALQGIADEIGVGTVCKQRKSNKKWRPIYSWQMGVGDILRLIPHIVDRLRVKRSQAELLIWFSKIYSFRKPRESSGLRQQRRDGMEAAWRRIKEMNRRGTARGQSLPRFSSRSHSRLVGKYIAPTMAAYLAGVVDGDGCLSLVRHRDKTTGRFHYNASMSVGMTCDLPVRLFDEIGVGNIWWSRRRNHRDRPIAAWRVGAEPLRWLLPIIQPYLVLKARQAELLLEYLGWSRRARGHFSQGWRSYYKIVDPIFREMRHLNRRGVQVK